MNELRYVLGISGGKDSTALAIYLKTKYPPLDIEYYFCDTGKELDETYKLIDNLEVFLGEKITKLNGAVGSPRDPFDHFLQLYGGYCYSPQEPNGRLDFAMGQGRFGFRPEQVSALRRLFMLHCFGKRECTVKVKMAIRLQSQRKNLFYRFGDNSIFMNYETARFKSFAY